MRHLLSAAAAALLLAACGGGGDGGDSPPPPPPEAPVTRAEAARFLAQASFGPTEAEIDRVVTLGLRGWIDDQFARPASSHLAHWDARNAEIRAATPGTGAGTDQFFESFWKHAVTGEDQLRQRVAFAMSQIFVISMVDDNVFNNPRAVAAWLDMLGNQGLGRYRELLENVSLHPQMGAYLSHRRNRKANLVTGRVPDENYAREVMQLFSIGLIELNEDGTAKLQGSAPVETYTSSDISGIAKVFTGWSWACPDWPDNDCFNFGSTLGVADPDREFKPMLPYPQYHSTEAKTFLGTTIPVQEQGRSDPAASLRVALDTLAAHPNVGPFLGRQLIQRFVTSNPSPAYVRDVARVWADNGSGQRGDLKAVIRAILLHPEARAVSDTSGKVREPVLRLAAFLRAFGFRSDTGWWRVGNTENPTSSLGQAPLRSPSVFNFYRPGYAAPGSQSAARGLVAPELQLVNESSTAGYVNFMRDTVASGIGAINGSVGGVLLNRRDVQYDWAVELGLATDPAALVDHVNARLLSHTTVDPALRSEIVDAVGRIPLPATGSTDAARRNRVNSAVLLVLASPEFQVLR